MKPSTTSLHRIAYNQEGLFTAEQARKCGFSPQLLAHHVRNGRYQRVRRGLYRLRAYPGSSREEVVANWLSVGADRAIVSHESALELHELSDVLPKAVHFLVDRKHRGIKPPPGVMVHTTCSPLKPSDVVTIEGMRVTSPCRSIVDAASAGTDPNQIEKAVRQALDQGLSTPRRLLEQAKERGGRVMKIIKRAIEEEGPH